METAEQLEFPVPQERDCVVKLRELRWKDGHVRCPRCNSRRVKRDGTTGEVRKYRCRGCDSYFNDRTGTIFEGTKVPLWKWFAFAAMLRSERSVAQISRALSLSYRNAHYIGKKIRQSPFSEEMANDVTRLAGAS